MKALHFDDPTTSTGLSMCKYFHKRSVSTWSFRFQQLSGMSKTSSWCQSHATRSGHHFRLTEDFRDVDIVQVLTQPSSSRIAPSWHLALSKPPTSRNHRTPHSKCGSALGLLTCLRCVPAQILSTRFQPPHSCLASREHHPHHSTSSHQLALARQLENLGFRKFQTF